MPASPLSYIELSRKNLIHNIKQFLNLTKKGTKFAVAIKGNAYGHGQNEVAKILEPYVDYFQVDGLKELALLRQVTKKQALVLGYVEKTDLFQTMKLHCVLAVFSIEQLKEIDKIGKKLNIQQEIHLPVDAHMGREGFLLHELPEILREIRKSKFLKLTGIYAHFADIGDTSNFTHAKKQIEEYQKIIASAEKFGFKNLQNHISKTAGILLYEKKKGLYPLVRLGIGIYGLWPSGYLKNKYKNSKFDLKPVLSWKSKIAQIKTLPKGRTIGYGLTYQTKKSTKVALVPQGYSDGLDRRLSNKGEILVRGKRCKILGRVSMNMLVIDVSHVLKVKIEDEVVILGRQGREEITAEEMANKINTINYEITTRISALLPKIIVA